MKTKTILKVIGLIIAFIAIPLGLFQKEIKEILGFSDPEPTIIDNSKTYYYNNEKSTGSPNSKKDTVKLNNYTHNVSSSPTATNKSESNSQVTSGQSITSHSASDETTQRINLNDYINSNEEQYDIVIAILNDQELIDNNLNSKIAHIYSAKGHKSSNSLFKKSFYNSHEYDNLCNGDMDVISNLNLQNHTRYIAFGKLKGNSKEGKLVNGTVVYSGTLSMTIISTLHKSSDSFEINNINGNGSTIEQAKDHSLNKILSIYSENHLNL